MVLTCVILHNMIVQHTSVEEDSIREEFYETDIHLLDRDIDSAQTTCPTDESTIEDPEWLCLRGTLIKFQNLDREDDDKRI